MDQPISSGGLGVSLLSLIGDLTNLISKNIVYGKAYTSTTATTAISNTTSALVKDASGNLYLAVTSPSAFQSVEIYLDYSTQLLDLNLGATLSMNVYYAAVDYPNNNCSSAAFTDLGAVTGISVALTDAVANPEYALRSDGTSHSTLGAALGSIAGVGSSISQNFYFPQTMSAGRQVKLDIQLPASLLDLTILQNITIQAYNGTSTVGSAIPLSSVIRLDLLGLFSNTGAHAVYLTPASDFNRIQISLNSGISVSLGNGVYIYGIHSVPPKPTLSLYKANVYSGLPLAVGLTVTNSGTSTVTWYARDHSVLGTGAVYNSPTPFTQSDTIYAVATDAGCTIPSDSAKFAVNVLTATPPTAAIEVTPDRTTPVALSLTAGGNYTGLVSPVFAYSNATLVPTGSGLTIEADGTISGDPIATGTFAVTATVYDQANSLAVGTKAFSIIVPYALPVKYAQDLTASLVNKTVQLSWQTTSEINNDYFDVQRSNDSKNWTSIGQVKSAYAPLGTGSGSKYSFEDKNINNGSYTYRLAQHDLDGKMDIGNVTSITVSGLIGSVLVYPNPVVTSFKLKNGPVGGSFRLTNIGGQSVLNGTISNSDQEINIAQLPSSVYFLEIIQNGRTVEKIKLLKK